MIDIKAIKAAAEAELSRFGSYSNLGSAIKPGAVIALCDEVERLRKDAARYRWLRSEHERFDPLCHLTWKQSSNRRGSEWVNTANLDIDIDAAMEAKP